MTTPTPPPKSRESFEEWLQATYGTHPINGQPQAINRSKAFYLKKGWDARQPEIDSLRAELSSSQSLCAALKEENEELKVARAKAAISHVNDLRTLRAQNEGLMKLLQESADQLDGLNDGEDAPGMTSYEMDLEKRINAALKAATPAKEDV